MKDRERAEPLRAQVYQALRAALKKGEIAAGGAVTERDLAEQLGVSRTPVREALVLLMHDGLISSTSRGFLPTRWSLRDVSDLYQIRRLLEPAALATTVEHLSAHDRRMLRRFLKDQEVADEAGDVAAFSAANSSFRGTWLGAVPNKQLRILIEKHDDHVHLLREMTLHSRKVRRKVILGLRNIVTAIDEGKPARVSAAMVAHLNGAERALIEALERAAGKRSAA